MGSMTAPQLKQTDTALLFKRHFGAALFYVLSNPMQRMLAVGLSRLAE